MHVKHAFAAAAAFIPTKPLLPAAASFTCCMSSSTNYAAIAALAAYRPEWAYIAAAAAFASFAGPALIFLNPNYIEIYLIIYKYNFIYTHV